MEAIQPASDPIAKVLSDRMNPLLNGSTIPDGWSVTSEDSLTPRVLSFKSNSSTESYFEGSGRALSRTNRHISAPNAETNYMEYLDLMKLEVDAQLDKLKGDVTGLENYALPDNVYIIGTHLGMSLDVMLIEIDERFNALKLLLAVVFRQAREMLDLTNPSVTDLQWEHELQLEIISITVGECITGLQEELERKLYEQISVTNTMSKNWLEAVAHFAGMREDLGALSKLLFPSVPESHISHSKSEGSGSKSSRWKLFGKKTKEDHASSRTEGSKSLRKQKSMVISEKSDFRHLNAMTKEETISYFKSEISKLKRVHESDLLEKTEELFKLKREKGSLALQNDVEFEPLRKKIPQIIARMDQIISKNIKAPSQYKTHNELDEKCRLTSRIDSLYYDNQHLRGLLADNMKDVKELSSQLSEASRDMSLQLSSEEELLRQIEKSKEEWEDLRIEGDVRDELYCTVTKSLLDDSMNDMHDAAVGFDAKLSSLEAVISEKEKTLLLSYEENGKLKEKLAELEKDMSLQLSLEQELLRQIEKSKEEREDLRTEYDVRDGLYRTVSRNLIDDSMNSIHDAALGFDAKLSSLEAVISEKEMALCLSYEENGKLKEKLAELEKDMSLQLSSEEELLRQIEKSKEEREDLQTEYDVRDGLYRTVSRNLLDDSMNSMHAAALGFDAKLSSLEAVISEKEKALCLSYEENGKLKEKLAELEKDISLQLSLEQELLRKIERSKEEREDLRTEYDVRDGLYRTVSRNLLDDSMNSMHAAALGFDAKLSSLEAVISEKEKALCLSYEENGKLKEKLAELEKDISLQLSLEQELLRKIERSKEEREDLRTEYDVRDGLYRTVSRNLLDDSMNSMHAAALGFDAKLSSLEAVISEKEMALCLSYEENGKLKEKLAELEKGYLFREHQEDPEVIKQESAEMILRDIEVEPQTSPGRSHESSKQGLQYDELLKLNSSNMEYDGALSKNGQEKQLECILVSIMKLSKEFVEIEQKLSTDRTKNRSEDLSVHCRHMVKQAVVLTKVGLWYKQMLEARRPELHKAEAKVVILGDKVNAHLSLLEKIYVTLDHYSPTLQKHPALLDAFLKTCKLVAGLRSIHDEEEETA